VFYRLDRSVSANLLSSESTRNSRVRSSPHYFVERRSAAQLSGEKEREKERKEKKKETIKLSTKAAKVAPLWFAARFIYFRLSRVIIPKRSACEMRLATSACSQARKRGALINNRRFSISDRARIEALTGSARADWRTLRHRGGVHGRSARILDRWEPGRASRDGSTFIQTASFTSDRVCKGGYPRTLSINKIKPTRKPRNGSFSVILASRSLPLLFPLSLSLSLSLSLFYTTWIATKMQFVRWYFYRVNRVSS